MKKVKNFLLPGFFALLYLLPLTHVNADVNQTMNQLQGKWNMEVLKVEVSFEGVNTFEEIHEPEEESYVVFHKNGTFTSVHEGEEENGEYKLHASDKLEIIGHSSFPEDQMEDMDLPAIYTIQELSSEKLVIFMEHSFTEDGTEVNMRVTITGTR